MALPGPRIRPATPGDLPAVKAIYDEQVATAVSTFDLEPLPIAYWEERLATTGPGFHVLVATGEEDRVLGYAYSSTFRPRPAYDHTRETSVYLDASSRGQGVGRALYDALLALLRDDGIHLAVAVVAQPNEASEALHRACGFEAVGTLPEVGFKLDRWVDLGLWALRLE